MKAARMHLLLPLQAHDNDSLLLGSIHVMNNLVRGCTYLHNLMRPLYYDRNYD